MPKNNSKARKIWRKSMAEARAEAPDLSPDERLLRAIFGELDKRFQAPKPGTDDE